MQSERTIWANNWAINKSSMFLITILSHAYRSHSFTESFAQYPWIPLWARTRTTETNSFTAIDSGGNNNNNYYLLFRIHPLLQKRKKRPGSILGTNMNKWFDDCTQRSASQMHRTMSRRQFTHCTLGRAIHAPFSTLSLQFTENSTISFCVFPFS